jgi:hypothetical protein
MLELDPGGRARTTNVVAAPKIMAFMAHQKSVTNNTATALH